MAEEVFEHVGRPVRYRISGLFSWFGRARVHRKAFKLWQKTGIRHWVVRIGAKSALIVNASWVKAHNKHNNRKAFKKVSMYAVTREAAYATPLTTKDPKNGLKRP